MMHLHDILRTALARFEDHPINILETGTIRGTTEMSRIGDGWSTLFFAQHQAQANRYDAFTSIDLDISVADTVLKAEDVRHYVDLTEGHSIATLASWLAVDPHGYDVILLDSDNDATLILHEFFLAQQLCRRPSIGTPGGIIIVDDVRMPHQPVGALKGAKVWPHIKERGLTHTIIEREGWAGYKTGVLIIEPY